MLLSDDLTLMAPVFFRYLKALIAPESAANLKKLVKQMGEKYK